MEFEGKMQILTAEELFSIDGGGWLADFAMDVAHSCFVAACGAIGGSVGTAICGGTGFGTVIGAGVGAVIGQKIWDAAFN